MAFQATQEQEFALGSYRTGQDLVIEAAAGAGKTSTLEMLSRYKPDRRGLYLAFNKTVAESAQSRFAGTATEPRTFHSLAYRAVGHQFRERISNKQFAAWGIYAKRLGITDEYVFPLNAGASTSRLSREIVTRAAQATSNRFLQSSDTDLALHHVVSPQGLTISDQASRTEFEEYVLELARILWADLRSVDGTLPYKHEAYLKLYQLSNPRLDVDFVFVDEAQDLDPLMLAVLEKQDCQRILVGDRAQAIYEWRGAKDAMGALPGALRAQLTQSFRFGPKVAEEAQRWLNLLGLDLKIKGLPTLKSTVTERVTAPDVVICRSNGGAIAEVLRAQRAGRSVAVAGERKVDELAKLAKAAVQLQKKGSTRHPVLQIFSTWDEVVEFSETEDGQEYAPLVGVVGRFGSEKVSEAIDRCRKHNADIVVSTAHIAKGLEWGQVQVSDDFPEPKTRKATGTQTLRAEEARLAYVTVTRAQQGLGVGGLKWVRDFENADITLT